MSKVFITRQEDGRIAVSSIIDDANESMLAKVLFELSRTTDRTTLFNAEVHTREAIAAGIEGHNPLPIIGECENTDLPSDRYFRNAWDWED